MKVKRLCALSLSLCLVLLFASVSITVSADKAITLKFAPGGLPNDKALFGGIPEWKNEIEKRTQGRVKIDVYYGETLAKGRENIDAMQSDLADIIFPAPHHQPGKLPLYTIGNVPGLTDDYWAKSKAFFDLLMTEKPLLDEFKKNGGHPVGTAYYPPVGLISPEPKKSLDDVKGIKVCAMYPASEIIAKFGAAPLSLAPPEQYEAVMRKTVNGIAAPVAAVVDFKFYEVAKYFTTFNLGDRMHTIVINDSSYAKLSPADQKIIDDFAPEYSQIAYEACAVDLEPRGLDILKNNGVNIIKPSKADTVKLLAAMEELATKWVDEMNGKGLPGTALMNHYKKLINKYEAWSPYRE